MRRVSTLLAAAQLCAATRHGFSIHHDLLAFPQFDVVLSDAYISEPEAKALLDPSSSRDASARASADDKDIQTATPTPIAAAPGGDQKTAETYEVMTMHDTRYLCAIPVIKTPPVQSKTETELAKAEEARELARASAHGWELVNALDGTCLYYVSGWWSYSFCYGHDVVQFHAMPSKGGKPQRDPHSQEYVLGRVQDPSSSSSRRGRGGNSDNKDSKANTGDPVPANNNEAANKATTSPPTTELQVKGDQRYLVQRMDDGTVCDLTNRPRTIEIQYHCSPGSTQDRIGWIKEVTTCSYLMLVNTPRLCSDVAFQPPSPSRANVISCRTIVPEAQQADWHAQKTLEAKAAMVGQQRRDAQAPVVIGGVVVGGRQILGNGEDGKAAPQLKAPKSFAKQEPIVEIIALGNTDDNGNLEVLSDAELEKLDIDPKLVEQLKKQIQEMAGENGWKLEIVEEPGANAREIRGVIDTESGKGDQEGKGESQSEGEGKGEGSDHGEEKGSEEKFFKEEL
ncbi:glucosidase II beta subunit-like protein-domain-containing protein [Truncatella angustata]|uniref:Endoplasmic reticulum lectin n=1 Tax=Truncatella angustata TaxID=152316 RepID=A0A9P8RJU0_9PEZI|nr:glucosidase II beta subunit-like protein-domain-containing protein [Truncatella angustata]KAH6640005.1 glucosidase II beta subunit-like protein-domain-containing protein [Truncatella angustata]